MTSLAGDHPLLEVDHDSRARIRDDLDRNLFVEAGAGTGKTRVLVDRVVRLVASGTVREIDNLVAITFTEAAAAELRDRVRRALEVASIDPDLPEYERERCAAARERLDAATITTLHGFANRILREYPLDAGLPPAFEVEDEVQARVRFNERWKRFRDDLFADPAYGPDLLLGHALWLSPDATCDLARLLHGRWDRLVGIEFASPPLPDVDATPIVAAIDKASAAAAARVVVEGDLLAEVVSEWEQLRTLLDDGLEAGDELEIVRVLDTVRPRKPGGRGRGELWGDAKPVTIAALTEAGDAVAALLDDLRSALIQRLLPRLVSFTFDGVAERKREGRLEFHDLLVHARDLLRSNAAVRTTLAARIDVILIDEFQDTDPLQLDIAFALAATDPSAEPPPWEHASLQPGKVLLVGDPKQSIYRFRGADISLWDRTKRLFPDGIERLGQNFRTVPPLLEWVNRVFGVVIAEGEEGVQPRYEALAPFRPDVRDAPAVVVVGSCVPEARAIELREQEAEDLARLIVTMKVESWPVSDDRSDDNWRPARFDDVAILVPTRTPLRQLERSLDRHDVPYRIESRSLVWATEAVREVLSILTAIDDPGDSVAIVAALRSPGFACSDVDLLEWKLAGGRWNHQSPRPEKIPVDHPVAEGMAALSRYHDERGDVPVNALVERVIRERKLVELTFVQRRPRDHWRRLRFVVDQARAFVEAGGASLGGFVSWAQLQTDENATVIETPAPEPDDDAVRILTIHGSKGLEFPIVVLAGLSSKPNTAGPTVHFGDVRPEVAVGRKDRRFATPGFAALAEAASDADEHEAKRLLYVAATRARDHLVISLHHAEKGQSSKSAAAALWKASHEAAAGWWREAAIADQLSLPVDVSARFAPMTDDERDAWHRDRERLLAAVDRRRVWAATALAGEADQLEPVEPRSAGDENPSGPPTPLRRGGTALGRAVHAVLQSVNLDDPHDVAPLAAVFAAAEGLTGANDVTEVERRVTGALEAPVIREARSAPPDKRWRELYVGAPVNRADPDTAPVAIVEGYIDLLFEDARGELVVVDYKTDRATTSAEAAAVAQRYRIQAAAYALAVGEVLQRPVARAVLVFCGHDGAVEHEIPELAEVVAQARAIATGSD
ncbi:MAG TPA: UvrD-helicase domain-containing protein [Acidimicrobiales bacterium]|nr:UvrD-helicase domain-containing protein [Acidimicrobiales bacterium]